MADIAYVRTRDARRPRRRPRSQVGVVGWLRENLFSSWLNAHPDRPLGSAVVWWLVAHILPWFAPCGLERELARPSAARSSRRPGARARAAPASR